MANGNAKYQYWGLIIDAPNEKPLEDTLKAFQQQLLSYTNFKYVHTIIHDRDVYTKEDEAKNPLHKEGEHKLTHLHAYLDLGEEVTKTKKAILEEVTELLSCNQNLITASGSKNAFLLVQYLTHKNDPTKAQYNDSEILSNNSEDYAQKAEKAYISPQQEEEQIKKAIFECGSITELLKTLPLKAVAKNQNLFNQVKHEQRSDIDGLQTRLRHIERNYKQLYDEHFNLLQTLLNSLDLIDVNMLQVRNRIKTFETFLKPEEYNK